MSKKKVKTIHLVWANTGSYSDRIDWNVKAYKDPAKAKAHAEAAEARAKEYTHRDYCDNKNFAEHMGDLDPYAPRWDGGVEYGTQEIEYEG